MAIEMWATATRYSTDNNCTALNVMASQRDQFFILKSAMLSVTAMIRHATDSASSRGCWSGLNVRVGIKVRRHEKATSK